LEKQIAEASQNLPDSKDYGNFKLRTIIYEHISTVYYMIYAPMVAVNETNYPIILQDRYGSQEKQK